MSDADRLLGKLEEFHRAQIENSYDIERRLDIIEDKLDDLIALKWKLIGAGSVVCFFVSALTASIIKVL